VINELKPQLKGEREICGLGGRVVVLWWVLYSGEGFYVTLADYMDLHTQI
jgi:hypothetical protein